jgi:hypothetical protein
MFLNIKQFNQIEESRAFINVFSLIIIVAVCFCGCVTTQKFDSDTVSKYEGFIKDGKTTRQDIQDRLGPCNSLYEDGKILIYHVFFEDDGRMNLKKGRGTCHALVLVFDKDNMLERHGLVKHGCQ